MNNVMEASSSSIIRSSTTDSLQFHIQYSINESTMVTDLKKIVEDVTYCALHLSKINIPRPCFVP
jgi:hypothetical protein